MIQFEETIDKLILNNQPFALWSEPNSTSVEMLVSKTSDINIINDESELSNKEGFIFAPFQKSESCPMILLQGEHLKSENEIVNIDFNLLKPIIADEFLDLEPFVISKTKYYCDINKTIKCIKNEDFSKVIISRITQKKRQGESLGKIFNLQRKTNSSAFVYLVSIPKVGIWIGATPELLIKADDKNVETVSLAGTQPKNNNSEEYSWRTKEIEEQAFVSRYILDVFNDFNIKSYKTKGPETLVAGDLVHLKTTFSFSAEKINRKLHELIKHLHPTPAVCGLPKIKSLAYINSIEKHKRRYYTGYLGPWKINNKVELYVNLRCAEVTSDDFLIYTGGGITCKSKPEEEWDETERKANIILSTL